MMIVLRYPAPRPRAILRYLLLLATGACGGAEPATSGPPPVDSSPSALVATTDTLVAGIVGGVVSPGPTVVVRTKAGNPVPGVSVHFDAAASSGTVGASSVTSGVDGTASTTWTLGTTTARQTLSVSVAGIAPVVFASTPKAAPAASLVKIDGDSQPVTVGTSPLKVPTVRAADQFGNVVAGVAVTATVASGGGSIATGTATTDASGIARLPGWSVGTAPGANQLNVSAGSGVSATFLATAVAGPAESVAFDSADSLRVAVGDSVDLNLRITDHYGNVVPSSSVTVRLVDATVARVGGLRVTGLRPGATSLVADLGALSASRPLVVLGHPDASTIDKVLNLPGGSGAVAVANGRMLVSTSIGTGPAFRGALAFFDTSGQALGTPIAVATSGLLKNALTPDGATALATTDIDSTLYFVDFATRAVSTVHLAGIGYLIKVSADGRRAYVSTSGGLSIVDLKSRAVVGFMNVGLFFNTMTSINSDSLFYFAGNGVLFEIDIAKLALSRNLRIQPTDWITPSADGKYLFSAVSGNQIDVIRISDTKAVATVVVPSQILAMAISPDGKYLYAASIGGLLYRLNVTNPAAPTIDRTTVLSTVVFDMSMEPRGSFVLIGGRLPFAEIIH